MIGRSLMEQIRDSKMLRYTAAATALCMSLATIGYARNNRASCDRANVEDYAPPIPGEDSADRSLRALVLEAKRTPYSESRPSSIHARYWNRPGVQRGWQRRSHASVAQSADSKIPVLDEPTEKASTIVRPPGISLAYWNRPGVQRGLVLREQRRRARMMHAD